MKQKRLTEILGEMNPRARMERRWRINAMADRWAQYLVDKHGDEALYRCRHDMVATVKSGAAVRNAIWSRAYLQLNLIWHHAEKGLFGVVI